MFSLCIKKLYKNAIYNCAYNTVVWVCVTNKLIFDNFLYHYIIRLLCYKLSCKEIASLNDILRSQSNDLTPEAIIEIVRNIGDAVKSLHFHSIIHGNICPDSILVIKACKVFNVINKTYDDNLSICKSKIYLLWIHLPVYRNEIDLHVSN